MISSRQGELLAAMDGALAAFVRPVAYLHIILITNGDDTSLEPVSQLVANVRALKADPDNQISVAAVVGPSAPRVTAFASSFPNSIVESAADASYLPALAPVCSSTNGGACWSLQDSPLGCPQEQALIVDNQSTGSDPARYGVVVDASCQLAPSL